MPMNIFTSRKFETIYLCSASNSEALWAYRNCRDGVLTTRLFTHSMSNFPLCCLDDTFIYTCCSILKKRWFDAHRQVWKIETCYFALTCWPWWHHCHHHNSVTYQHLACFWTKPFNRYVFLLGVLLHRRVVIASVLVVRTGKGLLRRHVQNLALWSRPVDGLLYNLPRCNEVVNNFYYD